MQRVLIVENEGGTAAELESAAVALGATAQVVCSGAAARGVLERGSYDVLILEPEIADAVVLLRELRAAQNPIEVLLVTARSRPAALVELVKLGIADYVAKPLRREELCDKLKKVLERRRRQGGSRGGPALAGRPERDVLLAIPDDAERAHLVELLGSVTYVAAADAATLARRGRLYACHAVVIDPGILGRDWPAFARATRAESLLVAVGDDAGESVDAVLSRPVRDLAALIAALRADADPVLMSGNVLRVQRGAGGIDRWYRRVGDELSMAVGGLGMARTRYAILDLEEAPIAGDRLGVLVAQAFEWGQDAGVKLSIVGSLALKASFADNPAAKLVPFFETLDQARDAARFILDEE